jgi:hypothetical protein
MPTTIALQAVPAIRLDYGLLGRFLLYLGLVLVLASPLSPDPVAFALGAMVPWLVVRIIATPTMPPPFAYWLLWQWTQVFARALVTAVDAMPMSRSVFGSSVESAYWYMMISIVVLAAAVRIALGSLRPPAERDVDWHLNWRPVDLFMVYVGSFALSLVCAQGIQYVPSLYQQVDTIAKFKLAAFFMLCSVVLTTGHGYRLLIVAAGIELVMGFTGLLSDFRSVFIVLAVAAFAVRVRISGTAAAAALLWTVLLVGLSLFWTAIKMDYRDFATAGSLDDQGQETQQLSAGFAERATYIGDRIMSIDDIDWTIASYNLLVRLAYVDVFGSVIGVNQFFGDQLTMRQWSDALSHVFQPRFLFPDKPSLSDTEVYMRLTRADPTENFGLNTSISVGYMSENYADMQFPGMLLGVFVVGFVMAGVARYFMSTPLPWMVRQSIVMAFVYAAGGTGVEVSLPKVLGASLMFLVVYGVLIRFAFPVGIRWLDTRARLARQLEENSRRAAASAGSFGKGWRP